MTQNLFFKNFSEQEKQIFNTYLENKTNKLSKYLKKFPQDSPKLEVKAEKFATKHAYKVTFLLELPGLSKIMAWEDDHTIPEAVDLALDKLIIQLSKIHEKNT